MHGPGVLVYCSQKYKDVGYFYRPMVLHKNTPLKSIRVVVYDKLGNKKTEHFFENPPGVLNDYLEINRNEFINESIPNLKRTDEITLFPGDVHFADDTKKYDPSGKNVIGTVGDWKDKTKNNNNNNTLKVHCVYSSVPLLFRSDKCPKVTMCSANVKCVQVNDGVEFDSVALCSSKGKRCPSPSQCILDDSKHIRQVEPSENSADLLEMKKDSEENAPVTIELPGSVEGGGAIQ